MKLRAVHILVLLLGTLASYAQSFPEKGVPLLNNYSPPDYLNKGKIWDISSAPNNIVYMAADKGLLEFDGKSWNAFQGSKGFTRSLLVMNDSVIYTGSDLDFGVWKRNAYNAFEYASLYPFRKDVQEVNEEFWDVYHLDGNVLFISSQSIFILKNEQLTKIGAPSRFTGSFVVSDSLYMADERSGLYVLDNLSLKKLMDYPGGRNFEVTGIYKAGGNLVIVTRNEGLFMYSSGKTTMMNDAFSELMKEASVFSFTQVGKEYLAFGTVMKGLFITGRDGRIIHRINKYKGLLSNTVLSLHYSVAGKLWIGTDYGVSSLFLNNDITYFYDYRGDFGTGYTAVLKDDDFYLGTNQGLYHSNWDDLSNDMEFFGFHLVGGTQGQVWTLENVDNTLFMGHDQGLFRLEDNQIEKISGQEGVWTILPYKRYLLTGNYNGISIFEEINDTWRFLGKMDLISGSCNQLLIEKENVLWVNIPNFGMIRAVLDSNMHPVERLIFSEKTFEGNDPYLLMEDDVIRVWTNQSQYIYRNEENRFVEDTAGMMLPRVESLLPGIYEPQSLHPDYDFYPVYNGFALKFNKHREEKAPDGFKLFFRRSAAFNNHLNIPLTRGMKVPFRLNNVGLEFIVPNLDGVVYQYKLDKEGEWSPWASGNEIELMGLDQGSHSIFVRAGINGKVIDSKPFSFRIAAPWYGSWYAIILYVITAGIAAYLLWRWHLRSLNRQQKVLRMNEQNSLRQQEEKYQETIMTMEQEQLMQEYEHVKQQLTGKTLELARKARDNEARNRMLLSLKEKIESVGEDDFITATKLTEIKRLLESCLTTEDRTFEIQLDELHQEFFLRLKKKFPNLSNNDLRLCAYLKIGMNSKEIAELLNIQPSSAYISRSRLRKKLNLQSEEELYDFLNRI